MSLRLSLVIPAHNESQRLPRYLAAVRSYLPNCFQDAYEVIVVDDGSRDGTCDALRSLQQEWPALRILCHARNLGKGAAVRTGMLAAQGDLLLFADADGATPIDQESRLRRAIDQGADIAVGSRLLRSPDVACRRSLPRAVVGRLFASGIRCFLQLPVRDTQCGFKMFRREVGHSLFQAATECGYLFDIEVILEAVRRGHRIAEVPIEWSDQPGSQLNMLRESRRIFHGLWQLRHRQITLEARKQHGENAT
jgi:dolichyl-phosphate beta-glucosyltransferase